MDKKLMLLCLLLLGSTIAFAQPQVQLVKVAVTPNSPDWKFKTGEKVTFGVQVTSNNIPLENIKIRYALSQDMMQPFDQKELALKNGKTEIKGGTMAQPGFLRCIVKATYNGKEYTGIATAGFEPEKIQPVTSAPADFDTFWANAIKENAKIPLSPKLTLLPDRCTDKANVYELSFQNYTPGSRIYGILSVPKAEGKYPALLYVPGAGVRPYNGDVGTAEAGVITLEIGIHGVPVTMAPSIYRDLERGPLKDYAAWNWDNRDRVYYKRVYLGCIKAIDYFFSMKEFDGKNVAVRGGSQGGALAIVTAALDKRITVLVSFYPALSDLAGYLHNRAGGWPHLFNYTGGNKSVLDEKVKVAAYYDVVNFAKKVTVPGFYSYGYNDMVCPPTTVSAAVNVIPGEKEFFVVPEAEHWGYPEQWGASYNFLMKMIKK